MTTIEEKIELTFWETAKVLEGRLEESKTQFKVAVVNFLSCPAFNFDSMVSAAHAVQRADTERQKHAGSARCSP